MIDLAGSEKQVAWAGKIRSECLDALRQRLAERLVKDAEITKAVQWIEGQSEAVWWINYARDEAWEGLLVHGLVEHGKDQAFAILERSGCTRERDRTMYDQWWMLATDNRKRQARVSAIR